MRRNNERWLADLRSESQEKEAALGSLRELIFRNLCKALPDRAADEAFLDDVVQDALIRILDSTASNWFLVSFDAIDFVAIVEGFVDVVSVAGSSSRRGRLGCTDWIRSRSE